VPSRGIYRIANATRTQGRTRLLLTKYLPVEVARSRLHAGAGPMEPRAVSGVLRLMYLGYSPKYARGGEMSFLLFNDREGIAIVSRLHVLVHSVRRRPSQPPPGVGAPLVEYRFTVVLEPSAKDVSVTTQQFKYSPGDIDKFTIELESPVEGYDYTISVAVEWFDVRSGKPMTLETPREVVEFPLYEW
jgi:hypothetical protein